MDVSLLLCPLLSQHRSKHWEMYILAPILLLAATAQAAILTLQSPRLVVAGSDGSQLRSEPLSLTFKGTPVELSNDNVLKVTFQVMDKESGKGVQPHQTFLRFYDAESGEEGIQPIRVTSSGKAKFELNMARPPLYLPPTSAGVPLKVTLLVGAPSYSPLSLALPDLFLPPSQPVARNPDEAFHLLPEIHHTFRPDEKLPPKPISAIFTLLLLAPWVVLVGLWSNVSPKVPHLASPSIAPFIASLGAFEVLMFWYWVDLKLGQVLLYGACLGLVTIFTGSNALANIASRRTGQK